MFWNNLEGTSLHITEEDRGLASSINIPMEIYQGEYPPYLVYGLIFLGIVLVILFFTYKYLKSRKTF